MPCYRMASHDDGSNLLTKGSRVGARNDSSEWSNGNNSVLIENKKTPNVDRPEFYFCQNNIYPTLYIQLWISATFPLRILFNSLATRFEKILPSTGGRK